MPYDLIFLDPQALAAAARGADNSVWSQSEARWLFMRAPIDHELQVPFWSAWAVLLTLSACSSALVILIICMRRRIRSQPSNHYIIGLMIPDLVLTALCALTCAINVEHGRYYDGSVDERGWMCDFQSFYSTFGIAGSLFANVLVMHELRRLTGSLHTMTAYKPMTMGSVYTRLFGAYGLALFVSWVANYAYLIAPSIATRPSPVRGLLCLPTPYSVDSQILNVLFTINLVLVLPLLAILRDSYHIFKDFRAFSEVVLPYHVPSGLREVVRPWDRRVFPSSHLGLQSAPARAIRGHLGGAGASDNSRAQCLSMGSSAAVHEVDAMVHEQSSRVLAMFFARLFVVLFFLWPPFTLLWIAVVPYHIAGGWFTFLCGCSVYLHGLVNAIVCAQKPDIKAEIRSIFYTRDAVVTAERCEGEGERVDSGVQPAEGLAEQLPSRLTAIYSMASSGLRRSSIERASSVQHSTTERTSPRSAIYSATFAANDAVPSLSEEAAMAALSAEAKAHIVALVRTPMLVVTWGTWLSSGAIPRSDAGKTREVEPQDVVVFISHRWWGPDTSEPDDLYDTKYLLICKGVHQIIAAHDLPPERVAIWVDFACIDQLSRENMALGIKSLVAYAARSAYVLIPVEPTAEATYALTKASHPIELLDFGERAWCRLETYVFICLSEVTQRNATVYAVSDMGIRSGRKPRMLHKASSSFRAASTNTLSMDVASGTNRLSMSSRRSAGSRTSTGSSNPASSELGRRSRTPSLRRGRFVQSASLLSSVLSVAESERQAVAKAKEESEAECPQSGRGQAHAQGEGELALAILAIAEQDERAHENASNICALPSASGGCASSTRALSSSAAAGCAPELRAAAFCASGSIGTGVCIAAPAAVPPRIARFGFPSMAMLARALGFVLRARMSAPREVFRPLLTTTVGQQNSRHHNLARFSWLELPSSGKLTVESDRAVIEAIERSVRNRFVQHAILAEKMRRSLRRALRRTCMLDYTQLEGQHLRSLAASLHADPLAFGEIVTLSLCGNLFFGAEIAPLVHTIVCSPIARSLIDLRLGHNSHLGVAGMEHIAAALASSACRLRDLHLDNCALRPAAGYALAEGLRRSSLLNLILVDNYLDNGAVMALIEARGAAISRHGQVLHLHVEGNLISPGVLKLVIITRIASVADITYQQPYASRISHASHVSHASDKTMEDA